MNGQEQILLIANIILFSISSFITKLKSNVIELNIEYLRSVQQNVNENCFSTEMIA